jgi:ketosteroid isomerase-like protein
VVAAGDLDALAGLLADDVAFENPRTRIQGATAVLEAMGQLAQAVEETQPQRPGGRAATLSSS